MSDAYSTFEHAFTFSLLVGIGFFAPIFAIILLLLRQARNDRAKSREPFTDLPLRPPAESLRLRIEDLGNRIAETFFVMCLAGGICATLVIGNRATPLVWSVALAVTVVVYVWGALRLSRCTRLRRNYRLGFEGERRVGEELNRLMAQGFRVFHDLPFDGFNVDHVLVGPPGVFAIETKTRSKPRRFTDQPSHMVIFDGQTLSYPWGRDEHGLDQAKRNAQSVAKWLGEATGERTFVQPILTLPGWFVEQRGTSAVAVVNPKQLRTIFSDRPTVLSAAQIQRIAHQFELRCQMAEDKV